MDDGTSQYYFTASMDSGKTLHSLLKAIQFQESAVFCAMSEGLKLTVEEGKCVQASAYVPADNFTEYHVRDDVDVIFKISIAVLTECLNIFGASEESSLKMYYRSEGSPLLLVLQPQSVHTVMTDCEIATQTADCLLELRDEDATEVAKLVLKASAFLGLLADLERSCDVMELHLSPDHPNVSIVTYGMQDRSCIEVPKSSDMMQSFSCEQPVTLKYQLPHIRLIMKALAISSKVVLRCSSNGLLLLQLKLEKDEQRQMFSEFHIVPLLDDY
ncbi:cell cycle checkpoint protein RAD1 [Bicyclus anynana]|uniref:Cell cycle checkpoint protein RAD1 n=1 Tax=Bicyclus anynana TaxID=110368 RepID=A0A6J1P1N8_BICAN|nr:cell cycle checkpoint protein RAD1 [Bicyclus anynana]XP_052738980.1 cell cycle checkpoint protein RAD1 [Bicyclus anynana]XP_052738981.1 cell cycle checkpoint protein RAD1 [Bicyclus anynana]